MYKRQDKRRISLGMKQCRANPWQEFAQNTKRGDRVKGPIKSITDFGVFVGLAAGKACEKCCKDKCAECCKAKGKECGKDCCKGE